MPKAKAKSVRKTIAKYSPLPFRTLHILLALSLLLNAALGSFIYYLRTSPKADGALVSEGLERACRRNYGIHLAEQTTPQQKVLFSEWLCHKNYITGESLPLTSSDGKITVPPNDN